MKRFTESGYSLRKRQRQGRWPSSSRSLGLWRIGRADVVSLVRGRRHTEMDV